jgi:nicotinamide-nucleotide amidase
MPNRDETCAQIGERLRERGATVAVAESLTGGGVAACFAAAPGASEWFRGSVVAYQKNVKFDVLDVPEGPVVTQKAAEAMARGVIRLMDADAALGITGAGGPDPQDGEPPGTVWIAVLVGDEVRTREHRFAGEPPAVIEQAADAGITMLNEVLGNAAG